MCNNITRLIATKSSCFQTYCHIISQRVHIFLFLFLTSFYLVSPSIFQSDTFRKLIHQRDNWPNFVLRVNDTGLTNIVPNSHISYWKLFSATSPLLKLDSCIFSEQIASWCVTIRFFILSYVLWRVHLWYVNSRSSIVAFSGANVFSWREKNPELS